MTYIFLRKKLEKNQQIEGHPVGYSEDPGWSDVRCNNDRIVIMLVGDWKLKERLYVNSNKTAR